LGPKGRLYAFEINPEFCELVVNKISDDRLIIVNKGAEELNNVIEGKIDGIISSIPFSIMPKDKVDQILQTSIDKLKPGAFFSQVQYSRVLRRKFKIVLTDLEEVQVNMIPPELIYHSIKQ